MADVDYVFRPRPVPTAIAAVAGLVLLALSIWQFARFFEKSVHEDETNSRQALPPIELRDIDVASAEDSDHRHARLIGTLDPSRVAYFDYHRFRGEPGCLVASPFALADGGTILVVRGFVPHTRQNLCTEATLAVPTGELAALIHTLRPNLADVENRGQQGDTLHWYTFDVDGAYEAWGIEDRPPGPTVAVLDQQHHGDPFPLASFEHVSAPYLTSMRHLNYAATWLISLMIVGVIWGATSIRRVPPTTT